MISTQSFTLDRFTITLAMCWPTKRWLWRKSGPSWRLGPRMQQRLHLARHYAPFPVNGKRCRSTKFWKLFPASITVLNGLGASQYMR